jgi:signal peptidase I
MRHWLKSLLGALMVATAFALVFRLFVCEDLRIKTDGMTPGLLPGDLVFVSKFTYNLHLPFSSFELLKRRPPRRGEVVAISVPDRGTATSVKRVVAIEGDRLEIRKGILILNGVPLKGQPALAGEKDYGPVDIPAGHFFALSDNRAQLDDSRTWGPVPYSCLLGKVRIVWLSKGTDGGLRKERIGLKVDHTEFGTRT